MARERLKERKKVQEPEFHVHVHDESNWLVSYADMMTLLFGFFVLMYSFSKIDKDKFEVVRKEVAKYFGGKIKADPAVQKLVDDVKVAIDEAGKTDVKITASEGKIQLRFQGAILFDSGAATLKPEAVPLVQKVVDLIKRQTRVEEVRVEGHTDDDPIVSPVFPSNWELSTARASTIVKSFIAGGFNADQLVAEGYAESRPLVPNRDETGNPIRDNQAQNRRVLVNITFSPDPAAARNAAATNEFAMKPERARKIAQDGSGQIPAEVTDTSLPAGEDPFIQAQRQPTTAKEMLKAAEKRLKEAEKRAAELDALAKLNQKIQALENKAAGQSKNLGIQPRTKPGRGGVLSLEQGIRALEKTAKPKVIPGKKSGRKPSGKATKLPTKKKAGGAARTPQAAKGGTKSGKKPWIKVSK